MPGNHVTFDTHVIKTIPAYVLNARYIPCGSYSLLLVPPPTRSFAHLVLYNEGKTTWLDYSCGQHCLQRAVRDSTPSIGYSQAENYPPQFVQLEKLTTLSAGVSSDDKRRLSDSRRRACWILITRLWCLPYQGVGRTSNTAHTNQQQMSMPARSKNSPCIKQWGKMTLSLHLLPCVT